MSHIFVSYSRRDTHTARRLVEELLDAGHDVWFDSINIHGGDPWKKEIETGIDNADIVMVVWSPHAVLSDWVKKEAKMALDRNKRVIPILIDGSFDSLNEAIPALADLNGHDFRGDFQQAWKKLLGELPETDTSSVNLRKLLEAGKVTFGDVHRRWRENNRIAFGDVVGILIGRSAYGGQAYLLGHRDDTLAPPEVAQVALQFSGPVENSSFMEEIIPFLQANKRRIWTILVRGKQGDTKYGWSYTLPNKPDVWTDMTRLTWFAIDRGIYSSAELHFFMIAPNALTLAIGAHKHMKNPIEVYNLQRDANVGKDRYTLVYRDEPM